MNMAVPKVVAQREMTLPEAIKWAMEGQTRLIDAEVRICIWESERIVKQARANPTWDTCFHRCLWDLHEAWNKAHGNETNAWQPIDTAPQSGKWVLLWWPRVTDAAMIGYRVSGEWRTAPGGDAWAGFDGPTHWQPSPAGPALKANTLPPCECLLIDKEPSAYHALKCPRYVADKI